MKKNSMNTISTKPNTVPNAPRNTLPPSEASDCSTAREPSTT